ncbi:MAG: tellurium resistance protein [Cereibacter sphaeroides]|uniref:Tellurium resistance protein n=1 Tax=Cereibacter sphaeroides TaxID=1063 RepID=A0A2W5SCP0_CERSP|nr:MAG: tellurium resistance protein [Cereibacter sphaeroides]
MPTAAKLVATLAFAALAYLAAEAFKPSMPDRTVWGPFNLICAGIGGLCGWTVMGGLVGKGYQAAMGYGLRTAVTMVFWIVIVFSIYEAVIRSTKMMYDGPMDTVLGMFELGLKYLKLGATPSVIGTLLLGGIVAGMLSEWANRQWR